MYGIVSIDEILNITASKIRADIHRRMIGLLFLKPGAELVSKEILDNGEYFHVRTGKEIDFFLPGYGPKEYGNDDAVFDLDLGDTGFVMRMSEFVNCIKLLQADSSWKYSGETDLLLLDVVLSDSVHPKFDTNNVICCNLDSLIRNKGIESIHGFLELIVQFVESGCHEFPTHKFSDLMGIQKGKDGFVNYLKSALPSGVANDIQNAVSFRTVSIEENA